MLLGEKNFLVKLWSCGTWQVLGHDSQTAQQRIPHQGIGVIDSLRGPFPSVYMFVHAVHHSLLVLLMSTGKDTMLSFNFMIRRILSMFDALFSLHAVLWATLLEVFL